MKDRIEAMARRRYEAYRFNMDERVPMWENTERETRQEFRANAEADAEAFLGAGPQLYELADIEAMGIVEDRQGDGAYERDGSYPLAAEMLYHMEKAGALAKLEVDDE